MDEITRKIFLGLIRIHILYHASKQDIYGVEIMNELKTHGYSLSPGTLYPILHELERNNHLTCNKRTIDRKMRKYYRITKKGYKVLQESKIKLRELVEEVLEDENRKKFHI